MPAPEIAGSIRHMEFAEKSRYRAAAMKARRLFQNSIGELIARELDTTVDFGWAPDVTGLSVRLLKDIERMHEGTIPGRRS